MQNLRTQFLKESTKKLYLAIKSIDVLLYKKTLFIALLSVVLVAAGFYSFKYLDSPAPTIVIQIPKDDQTVSGEKLFIRGVVTPAGAKVLVNAKDVALNGDGSFTAIVPIPEGKSTLKVEAFYRGKKAETQQLINRQLTSEETQNQEERKKLTDLQSKEEVLGVDQEIDLLLNAYNTKQGLEIVRVFDHKMEQKAGLKKVIGKVVNNTKSNAYWVKVTANFYDKDSNVLDTKIGFAAALDQYISPRAEASFETQSTSKDFSYYKLTVDWKTVNELVTPEVSSIPEEASNSAKKK